jgi:beta-glucosidase
VNESTRRRIGRAGRRGGNVLCDRDWPEFIWGVGTSAFQIEGATREDGRGPSIWDTFCAQPGKVAGGHRGEPACDHYHRWREDVALLGDIGVDAYRFSVSWPRIIPNGRGPVNSRGLDFYERLVDALLERGVAPHCTLYHWDLPQALEDAGGWLSRDTADRFREYAEVVAGRLGDRVTAYATLNEPWCSAFLGYQTGAHAPGMTRGPAAALQAAHHLLLAHGSALPAIRGAAPGAQVGIVLNLNPAYPGSEDPRDIAAAERFDAFFNRWYLDPVLAGSYPRDAWTGYGEDAPCVREGDLETISGPIDFLGVNYYSRGVVADNPSTPWPRLRHVAADDAERTAMGWEIYPQGLTDLLLRLRRDYRLPPVYVSENGAAYDDVAENGHVEDLDRLSYLARHIEAVQAARDQGVDVRGYFVWSLLDNFEWAHGYDKRFGVVHVDYVTQRRTPKASARWYAEHIRRMRERERER